MPRDSLSPASNAHALKEVGEASQLADTLALRSLAWRGFEGLVGTGQNQAVCCS